MRPLALKADFAGTRRDCTDISFIPCRYKGNCKAHMELSFDDAPLAQMMIEAPPLQMRAVIATLPNLFDGVTLPDELMGRIRVLN